MARIEIDDNLKSDDQQQQQSNTQSPGVRQPPGPGVDDGAAGAKAPHDPTAGKATTQAHDQNAIERLTQERDDLYDRFVRATAEFKNSQRRLEQDKEQAVQYANSSLIKALLPVIDNFDRALAVDPAKTDAAAVLKGLQIVNDQLHKSLKQANVETIDPKPGDPFNPGQHEALMQQPSDKYPSQTIVQVLQKGYAMHGRTLRPAGVIVSQGG